MCGHVAGNQSFGSVKITNGDGNDSLFIGNGNVTITKALTINNGVGNSEAKLGTEVGDKITLGSLSVTNGDGTDSFEVGGAEFIVNGAASFGNGVGEHSP